VHFDAGFILRVGVTGRLVVTTECPAEGYHVRFRLVLAHLVVLVDCVCKGDHFLITHGEQTHVRDHAGKEACGECSAGETEYVDSVSRRIVAHEEAVTRDYVRVEGGGEPGVDGLDDGPLDPAEERGVYGGAIASVSSYTGYGGTILASVWKGLLGGRSVGI
jgi:hypothetical protein